MSTSGQSDIPTRSEQIEIFQELADVLGRIPSQRDLEDRTTLTEHGYRKEFGGLGAARRRRLPSHGKGVRRKTRTLLYDLIEVDDR